MAVKTFTVPGKGIGKEDYSKEIALGKVRPGLTLKYRQSLKMFGVSFSSILTPYPHVLPDLAPGATAHIIDWETGLPLPYTVPAGYIYTAVGMNFSFNQDTARRTYMDGNFVGYLGTVAAGVIWAVSEVVAFSTAMVDPTAAAAHLYDVQVENLGGGDAEGTLTISAIMEAIGTKPLREPTKRVRCKWCGHEWNVPQETTAIKCPNCGELNIYFTLAHIREL